MLDFAISQDGREGLVKWPPAGYEFDSSSYDRDVSYPSLYAEGEALRSQFPELENWSNVALAHAWYSFGESTSYCRDIPIPKARYEYFLAFLYAKQELPEYDHGCLDELCEYWDSRGQLT